MTLASLLTAARRRLNAAGIESADLEAELLLRHALGLGNDRAALFERLHDPADAAAPARFEALVARRLAHEPSAYIVGRREFYGLDFEVGPAVLIPRRETEALVDAAIHLASMGADASRRHPSEGSYELQAHPERFQTVEGSHGPERRPEPVEGGHPERFRSIKTILDLGTGSGCIAVALATALPDARVYASDVSVAALALARRNAAHHGVAARIAFLEADLLALSFNHAPLAHPSASEGSHAPEAHPERFQTVEGSHAPEAHPERFQTVEGSHAPEAHPERLQTDLIVANLPYVKTDDWRALPPELRDHEPRAALDGGPDGLAAIRRLLDQAPGYIPAGAALCLEFGDGQADAVAALGRTAFPAAAIETRPDVAGRPRVLTIVT